MSMPFYVSPEQQMKDRADFARKGIARGRSVVVVQFDEGLLFVAENASQALHKISEIYDRIVFAAVGRYNEFENLRIAGVRLADLRGYSYDRRDVTGRGLANAYAQTLGTIFSSGGEKPYEIELFVAEIGDVRADDQIYRLTYDGSVADEHGFAVMGGSAEQVSEYLRARYADDLNLESALRLAVDALAHDSTQPRTVAADNLEVALLDRTRDQPRKFRRLPDKRLVEILQQTSASSSAADGTPVADGTATGDDSSAADGISAADDTTAANTPTADASTGPDESTSAQPPAVEDSETSPASGPGGQGDAADASDEIGDLPDEDKPADG